MRWRYHTGNDVDVPLLIGADGSVYAASLDGKLYAFTGPAGNSDVNPWPMFQRDPQRRGGSGDTNFPPRADAGADQTVAENTLVTLDGAGSSDPDGAVVHYAWRQTAGPLVTLSGAQTPIAQLTAALVDATTTLGFELTVTDDGGAQARDTLTLTLVDAQDTTAPQTAVQLDMTKEKGKTRYSIRLSSDELASTYFRIGGAGQILAGGIPGGYWQAYTEPVTVELGKGPNATALLGYYSVDVAGNQEIPREQELVT